MIPIQLSELLRVLVFLLSIAVVYLLAFIFGIRILFERIRREPPPPPGSDRFARWIFRLAALGILCFAYALFIEPYWPDVTHVRLSSPKMAPGTGPIRIVHISDLHCDPKPRLEERLPTLIAAQKPDLIVFTGDSVNSPSGIPILKKCMTRLSQMTPTFAVRGNWDTWFWLNRDLFGGTGARELNGEPVKLEVKGVSVWIIGVAIGDEERIDKAFQQVPPDAVTLFLYHYPDAIYEIAKRKVDLYCAGHTHGGQVALPFYGALVTFSKFGKRFEGGVYRVDQTWLSVNRGIGMEGNWAPRVRFCARPQITVIDLVPLRENAGGDGRR